MNKLKIILFYSLSFTWGAIISIIGALVAFALIITKHKPKFFYHNIYFVVDKNWSGLNLGPFFIVGKGAGLHTKQHESGHGIQNSQFGPLMLFIICIPSAIRHQLRKQQTQKAKKEFSVKLFGVIALLTVLFCLIPLLSGFYVWFILPSLLFIYDLFILIWLFKIEIPKYLDNKSNYNDIWFESQATNLGKKYFI